MMEYEKSSRVAKEVRGRVLVKLKEAMVLHINIEVLILPWPRALISAEKHKQPRANYLPSTQTRTLQGTKYQKTSTR